MDIALPAWLELNHEQGEVLRSQHAIHEHLQGDAEDIASPVPIHLQLTGRWHLRIVEVTEIARHRVPEIRRAALAVLRKKVLETSVWKYSVPGVSISKSAFCTLS